MVIFFYSLASFAADGFTQADRDRAIRTEVTLQEFVKSTDKRFEAVDWQFEDINNRIEDLNQFLPIVITIFAAVAGGVFIYIVWDRKTFMTVSLQNACEMVDEKLKAVQNEGNVNDLIKA
ncbi:MAG: hypothetical protein ACKVOU_11580 [Cytophagales bacterium]